MTEMTRRRIRVDWKLAAATILLLVAVGCAGRSRPNPPSARPPSPPPSRTSPGTSIPFVATAYCRGRITAAGTVVAEGIVAADPAVLPLGTVIRVGGLTAAYNRVYTVMDTGRKVRGRQIDLYMRDCAEAIQFGRRRAHVSLVRRS